MSVKNLVEHVTKTAVHGTFSVVRHPLGTAARAAGLVKGTAEAGIGLVRRTTGGTDGATGSRSVAGQADAVRRAADRAARPDAAQSTQTDRRAAEKTAQQQKPARKPSVDRSAGPPLREPLPAAPQRAPEELAEPFATEPKAASRASAHGGPPGDREEVDHYAEEVGPDPADEPGVQTPVGTTGADVANNPDTAEADLQQPDTEPLFDPAVAKQIRSETETLRKAADPDKT